MLTPLHDFHRMDGHRPRHMPAIREIETKRLFGPCMLADAKPLPLLDTDVWILTHPDLRRVNRIRVFTEFLHAHLSTHPALA